MPKKKTSSERDINSRGGGCKAELPSWKSLLDQSHPNAAARPGFKGLGRESTRKPYKAQAAVIQNSCWHPSWNSIHAKTFPFPKEMPSLWWQEKEVWVCFATAHPNAVGCPAQHEQTASCRIALGSSRCDSACDGIPLIGECLKVNKIECF